MKERLGVGLLLATGILFLILNRAAYQGFFQDDELDNLSWAPHVKPAVWITGLLTPAFLSNNFRPVGHFYFYALHRAAQIDFPVYVAVLQAFHLLNAALVWRLARQLQVNWWASVAAAAFFALNMAAFDAYWKPMYVFDVLCSTFCLLSLLCYCQKRWLLCFIGFWFAYKSKELAVMLPAVFCCYELLLGDRKWKRLIPFFMLSLSFGVQALFGNPNKDNDYTFRITSHSLAQTVPFYLANVLTPKWAGLGLLVLPAVVRDRRVWFGIAMMSILFFPLLFFPGRLFAAYVYLPQAGAALALAAVASRFHPTWVVAALALWMPFNIEDLRAHRRATLTADNEVRFYFRDLAQYAKSHPSPPPLVFQNAPLNFHEWGVVATARLAWARPDLCPQWLLSPAGKQIMESDRYVLMLWSAPERRVHFLERP